MYLSCMPTKWFALKSCTFMLNHHAHVMPENKPKAGMALHRFSQKTNKRICFVCCEKQKRKQNKFVHLFFQRIYGAQIYVLSIFF